MQLRGLGDRAIDLQPFDVLQFEGAARVEGVLPRGAVKDFNVIFDATLCSAGLAFHDGPGHSLCASRATLLVNVGTGACSCEQSGVATALARYDALLIEGEAGSTVRWSGATRVALVLID